MTEKRSDYRKRQSRKKAKKLLSQVKSAFDEDDHQEESVDVNPEFQRSDSERRSLDDDGLRFSSDEEKEINTEPSKEDKRLKLKKKLNRAILIVFVLIILVLLALFHL